jgi:hypothetical protein
LGNTKSRRSTGPLSIPEMIKTEERWNDTDWEKTWWTRVSTKNLTRTALGANPGRPRREITSLHSTLPSAARSLDLPVT